MRFRRRRRSAARTPRRVQPVFACASKRKKGRAGSEVVCGFAEGVARMQGRDGVICDAEDVPWTLNAGRQTRWQVPVTLPPDWDEPRVAMDFMFTSGDETLVQELEPGQAIERATRSRSRKSGRRSPCPYTSRKPTVLLWAKPVLRTLIKSVNRWQIWREGLSFISGRPSCFPRSFSKLFPLPGTWVIR